MVFFIMNIGERYLNHVTHSIYFCEDEKLREKHCLRSIKQGWVLSINSLANLYHKEIQISRKILFNVY